MSLIVADVGGTNARLAFQKNINSEISLIENFLCSDFKSLEDIINSFNKVSDTWLLPDYKSGKLPVCAETCGLINNKIIADTTWKERMELNALDG